MWYEIQGFVEALYNKLLNIKCIKDSHILQNITLQYEDYTIKDITYCDKRGLYHAVCKYDKCLYSLEAPTIDLLIEDLINSISFINEGGNWDF